MSRYRRIAQQADGAEYTQREVSTQPALPKYSMSHRLYGQQVAVGEPIQLHGDIELRRDIENSLEMIAQQRLVEAEDKANEHANLILAKARGEAAGVLAKANAQAKEMLQKVQEEVDGIRDAAYEEGFKAGFQEGYADASSQVEQETAEMLQGAHFLVESAYQAEKLVLKNFETHAADVVRHVVQRILRRELVDSPESLVAMLDAAVENLYLSGKVQVVVSSQIIQELREYTASLAETMDALRRFEWVADPALARDQLYVIGQDGCFDLSPETQAELLLAPLAEQLSLERPEPQAQTQAANVIPEEIEALSSDLEAHTSADMDLESPEMQQAELDPENLEQVPLEIAGDADGVNGDAVSGDALPNPAALDADPDEAQPLGVEMPSAEVALSALEEEGLSEAAAREAASLLAAGLETPQDTPLMDTQFDEQNLPLIPEEGEPMAGRLPVVENSEAAVDFAFPTFEEALTTEMEGLSQDELLEPDESADLDETILGEDGEPPV